jgi:hypothetical protein
MLIPNARIRRDLDGRKVDAVILDQSQIPLRVSVEPSNNAFSFYSEALSVAVNSTANVLTYIVPVGKTFKMQGVQISGTNIAVYQLKVNSNTKIKTRSYFTDYDIEKTTYGLIANEGDTINIEVENYRDSIADFNATIFGELVNA